MTPGDGFWRMWTREAWGICWPLALVVWTCLLLALAGFVAVTVLAILYG